MRTAPPWPLYAPRPRERSEPQRTARELIAHERDPGLPHAGRERSHRAAAHGNLPAN